MATNQDFNNLITRITNSTDELQVAVGVVTSTGSNVAGQLVLAQAAATKAQQEAIDATTQAGIASTQATTATTQATTATTQAAIATTQATTATTQATTATTQATKAETEALKAANSVIQANQAVTDAKALAPFQEAPKNGNVYGRSNGAWITVSGGGGGGSGTVVSVNNISPNALGNVEVPIPQPIPQVKSDWNAVSGSAEILNKPTLFDGTYAALTGKPTLFSGSYTDLTNKPVIPTNTSDLTNGSGFIADAPKNGIVYGRKDGTWSVVTGGGGGGGGTVVSVNNINPDALGNVEILIPQPVPQVPSDWNAVSGKGVILNKPTLFDGTYAALTGTPTLFSGSYADLTNKPTLFDGTYASLTGTPTAFSGSYTDLTNKPTIPTDNNQLTNGSGFIADAPSDGKQYARKSLAWEEVKSSGGGGGFDLITPDLMYTKAYANATTNTSSGLVFNTLAELAAIVGLTSFTPYTAIPLNFIYRTASPSFGRTNSVKYNNIFKSGMAKEGLALVPSGLYSVGTSDFLTPVPFAGKEGLLKIEYDQLNPKRSRATFYEYTKSETVAANVTGNKIYLWMPTIGASANEGKWAVVTATTI